MGEASVRWEGLVDFFLLDGGHVPPPPSLAGRKTLCNTNEDKDDDRTGSVSYDRARGSANP